MLTIRPNPCSYMCGSAARASRNGASSITARISRNISGGNSCTGATCCRPAQLTSTSAWPARAAASKSAARSTSTARPPMRPATAAAAPALRSATTTAAPSAASRVAQASPMPLAPPVTTATRPARFSPIRRPILCAALLATRPVPLGGHRTALRADQVGEAGRLTAGFPGLAGLAEQPGQHRGLAMIQIFRRGEQRQRPPGRGQGTEPAERGPLGGAGQLTEVALTEFAEPGQVMAVPGAQLGGRRDVLGPVVQPERVLAQAARPDPVDEHAGAVRVRRPVIDAAEPDIERRNRSHLPEQIYPYGLTRVPERLYPPPAGHRVHHRQAVQRGGAQPGAVQRARTADRGAQRIALHGHDDRERR